MESAVQVIDQVRAFNRFYTRQMGILNERFLGGPLVLAELRVLFEVAQSDSLSISELVDLLRLDQGYASRLVASLKKQGLVLVEPDPQDGRKKLIRLSDQGKAVYAELQHEMCQELSNQLAPLSDDQQQTLIAAMNQITRLLQPPQAPQIVIRPLQNGDLGHIATRHAILYSREQGWDHSFELAVMEVLTDYLKHIESPDQCAWVAEVDGVFAGCIFAVRQDQNSARLRALLVEPEFRKLGLGNKLIEQCLSFCRQRGYRKVVLWTCDALAQARRLYARHGFDCTRQWPETEFGQNLNSEHWELSLRESR